MPNLRTLDGYPDTAGAHFWTVFPIQGPASYVQMTTAPLAGGQTIDNERAGMKFFDFVMGMFSDSGLYFVRFVAPLANPSTPAQGAPAMSYRAAWYVTATGAQVAGAVNLSAEYVRCFAVGR